MTNKSIIVEPTANSQQPTANSQQPTANSQQPTANSQQPTANSQQLALLKKHFANCFDKHGNFIAAKLQEIVQDSGVALSKEGYQLNWLGKSYARLLANEAIRTRLIADTAHNQNPENANSKNLLIKGDNLEVLKHLMGAYSEQIKMIYIDPPYNTGRDGFVYQDDRKFTVEQLSSLAGIDEDEAKRILQFTTSSSNSHSAWLTFMYPRLYLARQLLRDDGVIFISIDDNEQAQLKVLCDEVFGEENLISQFIWNTEGHTDNQFHVKVNHEYVLMYARKQEAMSIGFVVDPNTRADSNLWAGFAENSITKNGAANPPSEIKLPIGFPCNEEFLDLAATKLPQGILDSMTQDGLSSNQLKAKFGDIQFPLRLDAMKVENHTLAIDCRVFSGWASANKLHSFILNKCKPIKDDDGLPFHFYLSGNGVIYYRKERGEKARNIVSVLRNFGTTEKMRSELEERGVSFSYPKPKELIEYLVRVGTNNNDIILDFFAGSGTTADAVMQLNANNASVSSVQAGNRQFICVQIDEATDPKSEAHKAGYKTIFDITQARIGKAAAKIKTSLTPTPLPEGEGLTAMLDLGFKVFATQPMFDKYLDTPESLTEISNCSM